MPTEWMSVFCGVLVLVVFLGPIVAMLIWRRLHPAEEQVLTPEQENAVRRQGNAFGILIFLQFGLFGIGWGIVKLFPALEEQVKTVGFAILFVAAIIVGFYIAISSIVDQISMFTGRRGWYRHEYPTGSAAIQWGIFILVVIGLVLYVAWLKLTGQ
jgi:hypothetical protein